MWYGTYCRLGVSVWDSNITVIRQARKKFSRKAQTDFLFWRGPRKEFYREMIAQHEKARGICKAWRM